MIAEELMEKERYKEKKGLSIASLVLGIISIPTFWLYYVTLPCSILAIVFGAIGTKVNNMKRAKTGLILGIIGLSLSIIVHVLFIQIIILFGNM